MDSIADVLSSFTDRQGLNVDKMASEIISLRRRNEAMEAEIETANELLGSETIIDANSIITSMQLERAHMNNRIKELQDEIERFKGSYVALQAMKRLTA